MPLSPGQVLQNRYRIVKLIGQGGFGAVYRAWDTALDQPCALKENLDTSVEAQSQFQREAMLLAGLRHPHLPRVIDHFFIPSQGQYLVMDFVEGQSLDNLLTQHGQPLTEAEVLAWFGQVCQAIDYLHQRSPSIIHRDIKPQNIIITSEGQAMLVDFGISKVYDPQLKTMTGARAISPGFSPIEQYGQGLTDARTDIYALGATLYTLLTSQVPPEAVDRMAGSAMLLPPRQLNPNLSQTTERAILKALEIISAKRFQTIKDFQTELTCSPVSKISLWNNRSRWSGRFMIGVGVLALIALLVGGMIWARSESVTEEHLAVGTTTLPAPVSDKDNQQIIEVKQARASLDKSTPQIQVTPSPTATPSPWFTLTPTATVTSNPLTLLATPGLFSDEFDGQELDSQKWISRDGGGQIILDSEVMHLTSFGQTFPLVYPRENPFPATGDFSLVVVMRYASIAERGAGFRIGTVQATYGANQDRDQVELFAGRIVEVWQDSTNWRLTVGEDNTEIYTLSVPELDWHEINISYTDNTYQVSVDGIEVYVSAPTTVRPSILWFGNPAQVDTGGEWSALEVNEIMFFKGAITSFTSEPIPTLPPKPISETAISTPLGQSCTTTPSATFADLWQIYRSSLGCPLSSQQTIPTMAEEPFQGGHLFWRNDTDDVYAIYDFQKNNSELFEGRWQTDPNWKWDGSNPDGIGLLSPAGLVEPKRGFGLLWRTHLGGAEGPLGWALDKEYGFDNTGQVQQFEHGLMFKGSAPKIYILLDNGTFYAK